MYFQTSSRETIYAFLKELKKKLCGNSTELQYLSVQPCDVVWESRWVMSRGLLTGLQTARLGPGENIRSRPPSKGRPGINLKIYILNQKNWLSFAEWLRLALKELICTAERDQNTQHSQSAPSNCHVQLGLWSVDWNIMGTVMVAAAYWCKKNGSHLHDQRGLSQPWKPEISVMQVVCTQPTTLITNSDTAWSTLTLILLMWRIWWAPNNASRWQMGFNLAFKGLKTSSEPKILHATDIPFLFLTFDFNIIPPEFNIVSPPVSQVAAYQ